MINIPYIIKKILSNKDTIGGIKVIIVILILAILIYYISKYIPNYHDYINSKKFHLNILK